jgi:hypothetical protein
MTGDYKALSSFLKVLDLYIVPDLRVLRKIRPQGHKGVEACTIPTAMFASSILDLLGFLIRPPRANKNHTEENICFACSPKAGLLPAEYDGVSKALVCMFRHGLMHQIFVKASGVSKPMETRPLIFYLDRPSPILNVDRFVDDLLEAVQKFRSLACPNQGNVLAKQVNDRLHQLQKEDLNLLRDIQRKGIIKPQAANRITILERN